MTWDSSLNETSESKCLQCNLSCLECRGGNSTANCTVCKAGYYLKINNETLRTGECLPKTQSAQTLKIYVSGLRSDQMVELRSSEFKAPTFLKAIELAFSLTESAVEM